MYGVDVVAEVNPVLHKSELLAKEDNTNIVVSVPNDYGQLPAYRLCSFSYISNQSPKSNLALQSANSLSLSKNKTFGSRGW
jgi:hypothetical protein